MPAKQALSRPKSTRLLQRRTVLRDRAIAVDDFPQDFSVEQVVPATPEPPAKTETLRKAA
jgi:hypothetical protein